MPRGRRVNPIILLGLVVVLILSLGIFASAQSGGGTASDAIGVGEAQVGKPFALASDGPDAFSCAGLIRYILRTIGVDPNAPWSAEGMLGAYPAVAPGDLQPGDLMLWPDHATMYVGNGMVLNANQVEGMVTHTPVSTLGEPMGIVRPPYGGGQLPTAPLSTGGNTMGAYQDPATGGNTMDMTGYEDPAAADPAMYGGDPTMYGTDPAAGDPYAAQQAPSGDPYATDTSALPADPYALDAPVAGDPYAAQQAPSGDPYATDTSALQVDPMASGIAPTQF